MGKKLVPDYEVKLLMDADKVLEGNGKLKDSVASEFKVEIPPTKMSIQFIDTYDRVIHQSGWNLRIRKSEGEKKLGLTYKKRFPITLNNTTDPSVDINTQVDKAHGEGFDSSSDFEAQVEVGYTKQTLSISYSDKVSGKDYDGMELPRAKDSRKMLTTKAPQQFSSWSVTAQKAESGSEGPLADAVVYGPIDAERYTGYWGDIKLYIEAWPIRTSLTDPTLKPTVEASFKTDDVNKAMEGLRRLRDLLKEKEWLQAQDSLKTNMIMDNYSGVPVKS